MTSREEFEAWYDSYAFRREYDKYGPTECAWSIWQDAIKHEREACAKVCEFGPPPIKPDGGRVEIGEKARKAFAAAIRDREVTGETKK